MSSRLGRHCAQRSVLPSPIRKLTARLLPGILLGGAAAASGVALAGSGAAADAADAAPALPDHPALAEPHSADLDAAVAIHHVRQHKTVTVAGGDTLSGLARARCGAAGKWENLYAANEKTIGDNPNLIQPGQKLRMWCNEAVLAQLTAAVTPTPRTPTPQPQQPAVVVSGVVNTSGVSSFEACVINAESGGNAQAVNPATDAGGTFQFLPSTWAALGFAGAYPGGAQTAPESVQQEAFNKEYAESGTSAWAAYDGC